MAGTVLQQTDQIHTSDSRTVTYKTTVTWTSDGSGNATGNVNLHGFLLKVVTDPTDGPTDNYDITLVADGIDVLGGALADRDTTNTEQVYPVATNAVTPIFVAGDHTFTVANAGSAKSGVAYFYVREG